MTTKKPESAAQKAASDFAPKLAQLTDDVLFGDVWERPELSKRDRSLITCAALVALGKTEQMTFHFPRALENGVTRAEIAELITHLAFYVGWLSDRGRRSQRALPVRRRATGCWSAAAAAHGADGQPGDGWRRRLASLPARELTDLPCEHDRRRTTEQRHDDSR